MVANFVLLFTKKGEHLQNRETFTYCSEAVGRVIVTAIALLIVITVASMFFGNKAPFIHIVLGLEEVLGALVSAVLVLWLQRLARNWQRYFLNSKLWLRLEGSLVISPLGIKVVVPKAWPVE